MDEVRLRAAVAGQIRIGTHGLKGLRDDALDIDEVRGSIVTNGVIIEDYPNDQRGPSCLMLSFLSDGRPVHTCWAWHDVQSEPFLITVYRPSPLHWQADCRTRK